MNVDFNYHGEVVVFDLDDTLIRERDYCRSGFRMIEQSLVGKYGDEWRGVAEEMRHLLEARSNYFDHLEKRLTEKGLESEMKLLVATYRSHIPESLPLISGMTERLEDLAKQHVIMGIITDGRSVTQRAKIRAAGIERYFNPENILISEETGADKHTQQNFRYFVRKYPEARRFLYIGDNPSKDVEIPSLLGWDTELLPPHPDNVHNYTTS